MDDKGRMARAVTAIKAHLTEFMTDEQADERARNIVQGLVLRRPGDDVIGELRDMLRPIDEYRPGIEFAGPRAGVAIACYQAWLESGRPER